MMNAEQKTCAERCLDSAETDRMTFPEIVGRLADAGFESYEVDFRRASAVYYLPSGESCELPCRTDGLPVKAAFETAELRSAIRDAQTLAAGYTYKSFCKRAKAAGCAGYLVSRLGRRVVYFGRTGETHVELFSAP